MTERLLRAMENPHVDVLGHPTGRLILKREPYAFDIDAIVKWVDAGAPQGNPADMPPPRQWANTETWQIGTPDVIVTLPKDVIVRAKGPDQWPDILADPALAEDRYI